MKKMSLEISIDNKVAHLVQFKITAKQLRDCLRLNRRRKSHHHHPSLCIK